MRFFLSLFLTLMVFSLPAIASDMVPTSSDEPIEITADETIEWLREENRYRAVGNAVAIQGSNMIEADTLTAVYDPDIGQSEITTLIAEGGVKLISDDRLITGDKAVFDVKTEHLTVTGQNLRFTGPGQEITASESLEYFGIDQKAIAKGDAFATNNENTIYADVLTAFFAGNGDTTEIKEVQADGSVKIITPTEVVMGEKAMYNAVTEQAEVTGDVRITRDQNQLNGERAQVDMKTGVSKMFGAPVGGGRVRALFYPNDDETKNSQNEEN